MLGYFRPVELFIPFCVAVWVVRDMDVFEFMAYALVPPVAFFMTATCYNKMYPVTK
jgi:hypothetical protein